MGRAGAKATARRRGDAIARGVSPASNTRKAGVRLAPVRPSDELIREAWRRSGKSPAETARLLGNSESATRRWLAELGLFAPRAYKRWTQADLDVLRREYDSYVRRGDLQALADKLGTTIPAIKHKASQLGLCDAHRERPYQWRVRSLSKRQLRQYLDDLRSYEGTASEWQRERGLPPHLIDEIRRRLPAEWERAKREARERSVSSSFDVGKGFEYRVMSEIRALCRGYSITLDAWDNGASWGAADVIVAGHGRWYAIQAEASVRGQLSQRKWNRLYGWAMAQGAVPLYARAGANRSIEWYRLDGPKGDARCSASPMTPWSWDDELSAIAAQGL